MIARIAVAVALLGSTARADVIDESVAACQNREAGDACSEGVCAPSKCGHARPGQPPSEWDCLRCVPGEAKHTALFVGLGVGVIALAVGVWFARKRGKRAP